MLVWKKERADTAKRRVRWSQKGSKKRQIVLRNEALAEEAEAAEAKRACALSLSLASDLSMAPRD